MGFLIRTLISAVALWAAVRLVTGVDYSGTWLGLLGVALVFGILNAIVRPVLIFFSIPLLLITLGLFTFVINGVLLLLTAWMSGAFGMAFYVRGIWSAILGALVVTIVSMVLSKFVGAEKEKS